MVIKENIGWFGSPFSISFVPWGDLKCPGCSNRLHMRVFPVHFCLKLELLGNSTSRCICRICERVKIATPRAWLRGGSGEGEVEISEVSLACGNTVTGCHFEAQSKVQLVIWNMQISLNRNPNSVLIHLAQKNMICRDKTNKITDNLFGI